MDGNFQQRRRTAEDFCESSGEAAAVAPVCVRSLQEALIEALDIDDATRAEAKAAPAPVADSPAAELTLPESPERSYVDFARGTPDSDEPDGQSIAVEPPILRERGAVRFRLSKRLGRGGMAEVYGARELASGRRCAIKIIRPASADKPRTRARFRREAELMQRVQHPNVARCEGLHEADDGTLYMVLEYVEGQTLKSLMRSSGELGVRTGVSIILQLLRALDAVHTAGLVHRDVKPSNVMVTRDEDGRHVVKLIDFGLAEVVDGPATRTPAPEGRTLGTPAYVAPEQVMGLDPDPRSDVYSASAVLYEMFTGERVFRARSVNRLVLMHLHDKPVPVRARAPWLSKDLGLVVMKGLHKRQETRFPTAREFARGLARAMRPASATRIMASGS